jgi:hypothetical protein
VSGKAIPSQDEESIGFQTARDRGLELLTKVDGEARSKRIGNHLEAIAYLDNSEGTGAAILLEFKTVRNQVRRLSISRSDLAGDGVAILSYLMGCGYYYNRKIKQTYWITSTV